MIVLKNSSLQQNVSTVTLANVNMGVKNRQGYVGNSSNLTINVAQAINSNNFATS